MPPCAPGSGRSGLAWAVYDSRTAFEPVLRPKRTGKTMKRPETGVWGCFFSMLHRTDELFLASARTGTMKLVMKLSAYA